MQIYRECIFKVHHCVYVHTEFAFTCTDFVKFIKLIIKVKHKKDVIYYMSQD